MALRHIDGVKMQSKYKGRKSQEKKNVVQVAQNFTKIYQKSGGYERRAMLCDQVARIK